jgi:hypothetical protein
MRNRYVKYTGWLLVATFSALCVCTETKAQFDITSLPEPSGGSNCQANAASNAGHVVGRCSVNGSSHAILWVQDSSGNWVVTDLHNPNFLATEAGDVNDAGHVIGWGQKLRASGPVPLRWNASSGWLGWADPLNPRSSSTGMRSFDGCNSINNEDTVVGTGRDVNGMKAVWKVSWNPSQTGRLNRVRPSQSSICVATAINDGEDVVGECAGRAFFFSGERSAKCASCAVNLPINQRRLIANSQKERGAHAKAINNARMIVGWTILTNGDKAARLWQPSGSGWRESEIGPEAGVGMRAVAINDAGQTLLVEDRLPSGYLLPQPDANPIPLERTLITSSNNLWKRLKPSDITNAGRIVGAGASSINGGRSYVSRAFVMIPRRAPGLTRLDFPPEAINNLGHVVGGNLLWLNPGQIETLGPMITDGLRCVACDINDLDIVAGRSLPTGSLESIATFWSKTGAASWQPTVLPESAHVGARGIALGVNSTGDMVGYQQITNHWSAMWSSGSLAFNSPICEGIYNGAALGKINALDYQVGRCIENKGGVTVSYHAALFSHRFGTLLIGGAALGSSVNNSEAINFNNSDAININSRGQTVGWVDGIIDRRTGGRPNSLQDPPQPFRRGFLWEPTTKQTTMLVFSGSGVYQDQSGANGINSRSFIVGNAPISGRMTAVIWKNGPTQPPVNLNTLVPTGGWHLSNAFDINDAGQILVAGVDSSSNVAYFLLTSPSDY